MQKLRSQNVLCLHFLFGFAAVLWPHSDHVHCRLFLIPGGFSVGSWYSHIFQVKVVFLKYFL